VVAKLLTEGLVEEIRATSDLPVWRRDETEGAFALRITKRGLAAIQVDEADSEAQEPVRKGTALGAARSPRAKVRSSKPGPGKKVAKKAIRSKERRPRGESKQADPYYPQNLGDNRLCRKLMMLRTRAKPRNLRWKLAHRKEKNK
jgi:hypothetical protein